MSCLLTADYVDAAVGESNNGVSLVKIPGLNIFQMQQ